MRVYLTLIGKPGLLPINYQPLLTGAVHKWIGADNLEHGKLSLYSFSGLKQVNITPDRKNVIVGTATKFFISVYDNILFEKITEGIKRDPSFCNDITVYPSSEHEPIFKSPQRFMAASPIFVKKNDGNRSKHLTYEDNEADNLLTHILIKKFNEAKIDPTGVKVEFDHTYSKPRTKLIKYNNIMNKANLCPVIISGKPEQIAFAWNVGVGHCTGIGFGAIE